MYHVPSLIVVEERLYAVGGLEKDIEEVVNEDGFTDEHDLPYTKTQFLQYDNVNNTWDSLLPIKVARQQVILVHLDGFIYAIAGLDEHGNQKCDVERYNIANRQWTKQASLPGSYTWESAVACQGKILVNGLSEITSERGKKSSYHRHVVQVYDPSSNTWQAWLSEELEGDLTSFPVLFYNKESLYRVYFYRKRLPRVFGVLPRPRHPDPVVNMLEIQENVGQISVGKEIKQDRMLGNGGAFQIDDEVFIKMKRFIHKTSLKISANHTMNVSVDACRNLDLPGSITYFTFDKKRLGDNQPE